MPSSTIQLEELLLSVEVKAGDVVFVPAGTVHAIGAGVALYELQEYSDITYRLYDYGRIQANGQLRELHVERALDVMRYDASPTVKAAVCVMSADDHRERRTLAACAYFVEEELRLKRRFRGSVTHASLQLLTVLEGACELQPSDAPSMSLGLGDTAVLPAGMGDYAIEGRSRLIRAYVPEPNDESLILWRAAQSGAKSNL